MFVLLLCVVPLVSGDTYNVVLGTQQHVNLVDRRFLSFTVDPKYLFESEKYKTKECLCMATSLAPAYLRVAGPSTDRLLWRNTSISLDDDDYDDGSRVLSVSSRQYERFVKWARSTGFRLVVAVGGAGWEKMVGRADVYWQLGYECTNQSIEEYLSDLESLRMLVESAGRGRVVGGDITPCLRARSDFKDYVTLANDRMDAILLNSNSSSRELERLSERDRISLLRLLSQSSTPLWLTETDQESSGHQALSELYRAADWMTSLGYSARNGFSVHYRELLEKELYEPTLSFYMALLFKNLVGERVLSVDVDSPAAMFAHCTTLRHQRVAGAVTLYAANMNEEVARFSVKLGDVEEGGDVLQFILGHDYNGNIVVNGRPMYYEGDIKPVVRRIRPYKTLLLNLPSNSFGFWVLANTKVEACQNVNDDEEKSQEDMVVELVKRAVNYNTTGVEETQKTSKVNEGILEKSRPKSRIDEKHNNLKVAKNVKRDKTFKVKRVRRDIFNRESRFHDRESIFDNLLSKVNIPLGYSGDIMERINQIKEDNLERLRQKKEELSSLVKRHSRRLLKRRPKMDINDYYRPKRRQDSYRQKSKSRKSKSSNRSEKINEDVPNIEVSSEHNRKKRSILNKKEETAENDKDTSENKIDKSSELHHIDKIIHRVKKIGEMPVKIVAGTENYDYYDEVLDGLTLNTKMSDDSAMVRIEDESHSGLLKNTLQDIMGLLRDLNQQINRFWSAITVLN
ncbi:uncharacterized protein LOC121737764 [Aricia agestis]|uniref:uncharacterized protein LOC121737764 n=1 Tax=Aricia agestis TaxID=91739 RepID=UPI001C201764|nr:uncharacterized protein LOC121737764 [Aricia agestis]